MQKRFLALLTSLIMISSASCFNKPNQKQKDKTQHSISDTLNNNDYNLYLSIKETYNVLYRYRRITITSMIEQNQRLKLNSNDKKRYDNLLQETLNEYENCMQNYESGNMKKFWQSYNKICNSDKYICLDDIMNLFSIIVNDRYEKCEYGEKLILKPNKYHLYNNYFTINGIAIYNLFDEQTEENYDDIFYVLSLLNNNINYQELKDNISATHIKLLFLEIIKNYRVVFDEKENKIYTFSIDEFEKVKDEQKRYLKEKYTIKNWYFHDENKDHPYYIVEMEKCFAIIYEDMIYKDDQKYYNELYQDLCKYEDIKEQASRFSTAYKISKEDFYYFKEQEKVR